MSKIFKIHAQNPQIRLINDTITILNKGGVIVYPTDSGYALGCKLGVKSAVQRILDIRKIDLTHHLTLVCSNLKEIGNYAIIDDASFKLVKYLTHGGYTFILRATKALSSLVLHPKRKTIGTRITDNKIALAILKYLQEPIVSCSLILPDDVEVLTDIDIIQDKIGKHVDLIIDGGYCGSDPTSIIDLTDKIKLIRKGKGDISILGLD